MTAFELKQTPLYRDPFLQGYYQFEDNWNDIKNARDLSTTGSPTFSTGVFGKAGDFTGGGKDASVSAFEYTGSFTWMGWFYITVGAAFDQVAVSKSTDTLSVVRRLVFGNGGSPTSQFWTPGIGIDGLSNSGGGATGTVTSGEWNFIAGIYDQTNTECRFWVNGTKNTTVNTGTVTSSAGNFHVGSGGPADNDFDGKIDDLQIYNRALTDLEVKNYYQGSFSNGGFLFGMI